MKPIKGILVILTLAIDLCTPERSSPHHPKTQVLDLEEAPAAAQPTSNVETMGFDKPHFESQCRNQTVVKGDSLSIRCKAVGEIPMIMYWSKNGVRLEPGSNDSRYTVIDETLSNGLLSYLSTNETERMDSALYTCIATNRIGSDGSSVNLIIQEPPEPPFGLKVVDRSGRSLQLEWREPFDGNSAITRFYVEYKDSRTDWNSATEDNVVEVDGRLTAAIVANLIPAKSYHVRVFAENELGRSGPSQTLMIITAEEAPSASPTNLAVQPIDQHSLRVSWDPPYRETWNGDIHGYNVVWATNETDNGTYQFETTVFSHALERLGYITISKLKTFTEYSVAVQAFNSQGSGPMSEIVTQRTAEGKPEAAPEGVSCTPLTSQSIKVEWGPPPNVLLNGVIEGYRIKFGPVSTFYDETLRAEKVSTATEIILDDLQKYTNYSIKVAAFTSVGDGVYSDDVSCHTDQDRPGPPVSVEGSTMSNDSVLLTWQPPKQSNGLIMQYNVYRRINESDPVVQQIPAFQTLLEVSGLNATTKYEFLVTASTLIGEGPSSPTITISPSNQVQTKIVSFGEKVVVQQNTEVTLRCRAVGIPKPAIKWSIEGRAVTASGRRQVLLDGSLLINDVAGEDSGNYTCKAQNLNGQDVITHTLVVQTLPPPPILTLKVSSSTSITVELQSRMHPATPLHGVSLFYKPNFGDWETVNSPPVTSEHTFEGLRCGTRYQIYATARNVIGTGEASDILNAPTKGGKPGAPASSKFIQVSQTSATMALNAWDDSGCPMVNFMIEYKQRNQSGWTMVSDSVQPIGNYVILDLSPGSLYLLRVTAHNVAGLTQAGFEFATLTPSGSVLASSAIQSQPRGGYGEEWIEFLKENIHTVALVIPAAVFGICSALFCLVLAHFKSLDSSGHSRGTSL